MALSVLVALMMLAVPLASSSNLFVDGGQTNSNGDAPTLGAAGDTYILYFDFNVPENSLDAVKLKQGITNGTVTATTSIGSAGTGGTAGSIEFSYIKGETAQEDRILAYVKQPTDGTTSATLITIGDVITNLNSSVFDGRLGYNLVSWKGTDNNDYTAADKAVANAVSKNMTYTANWELSSVDAYVKNAGSETDQKSDYAKTPVTYEYKEFKVNVTIDGETKEYVKAYLVTEDADGNPIIEFDISLVTGFESSEDTAKPTTTNFNKRLGEDEIAGIGSEGFMLLAAFGGIEGAWEYGSVYKVLTTDSYKKVVFDSTKEDDSAFVKSASGDSQNVFNVSFELPKTFTMVTISSIVLSEDVKIFVMNSALSSLTYFILLQLLLDDDPLGLYAYGSGGDVTNPNAYDNYDFDLPFIKASGKFNYQTGELSVNDDKYVLTGWNGSVPLMDQGVISGTSVTLDARTNVYNVIFMVNGEYEVVEVTFGTELSANLTKLDVGGVDHWVTPVDASNNDAYTSKSFDKFMPFRFSPDEIEKAESLGSRSPAEPLILIACFQPANKTAYAVFNAGANADFGNELVTTIVIPGEINTPISQTPSAPVKEGKNIFIGWETPDYTLSEGVYAYGAGASAKDPIDYNSAQKYSTKDTISKYDAKIESYKWTISFSADGSVVGVLYYIQGASNTINMSKLTDNLVAYQYDGKMYKAADVNGNDAAKDAFANIVSPLKDGYLFKDWIDADGKVVLDAVKVSIDPDTDYRTYTSSNLNVSKLTGNLTISAEFDAKPYTIEYSNTFGDSQKQTADVDEAVKLYGEIYLNEGFKLLGWSTSAGSSQVEYELEGSFTLSGADYEKLVEKNGSAIVNMYPVWEKLGSGSGTGGNTGGDNDNTALYLIAGMLAVIAILAIVGILLMRRK